MSALATDVSSPPLRPQMRPIVIAGPTAVGKTEVAIDLARELGAQIISVDSRQVYRYMDIGTAKPDRASMAAVRHHLIDVIEADEHYSAGRFGREARDIVARLAAARIRPIFVGGSGLYLAAYTDGLFDGGEGDSTSARQALRARLEVEGLAALYQELGRLDPQTQLALSPNDEQRILRALELVPAGGMHRLSGSEQGGVGSVPIMLCLSMERSRLYERIDARVDVMIESGWVAEVEGLLERGFDRGAIGMKSLGYEEILSTLDGTTSLGTAIEAIKRRSRRYAKRQMTWFRKDRRMRWLDVDKLGRQGLIDRVMTQLAAAEGV